MVGTALVLDTETTGIFNFSEPADGEGQPRMLSIGAVLIAEDGEELDRMYALVRPEGFEVDEKGEAFQVNKLTNERLMDEGLPVAEVLARYDEMTEFCDFISAFNIGFDQKMVRAEQRRAGRDDRYGYRPTFELMYRGRSLACQKGAPHSNPRKLGEVFENICGKPLEEAHDAQVDVNAAVDILRHLLIEGMVEPKAQVSKK